MTILNRQIAYTNADKFVLGRDETFNLWFAPKQKIETSYGIFETNGKLTAKRGYLWSANFPAINTEDTRPASLVHDLIYDLIKDGLLPREPFKDLADKAMMEILIECKVPDFRAWAWYRAVQAGGDSALDSPRPKLKYAPPEFTPQAGWQVKDLLNRKP